MRPLLCLLFALWLLPACQSRPERSQVERGGASFMRICSGCHGPTGKGGLRLGFDVAPRDLTDAAFQASVSDAQLLSTLHNGKGQMPAFGALLPEEELVDLIAFVRSLNAQR